MRDSSTRSFSAVGMQGVSASRRRDKKRKLLIAALTVVCLLIALFTFLIFAEIFGWFAEKAPEGPGGDVVGGIKLEYEDKLVSTGDAHTGDLILINPSFPYVFPETNDEYLPIYTNRNPLGTFPSGNTIYSYYPQTAKNCAQFEKGMLEALNAWTDDFYRATGAYDLFIYDRDGYRTEEHQTELFNTSPSKYLPAGQTEHHTGKVVDLYINKSANTPVCTLDDAEYASTYKWLYENAYKYGFINRYPTEKAGVTGVSNEQYHFRYVGVVHATYMYQNNLCLEEYLDLLRDSYKHGEKHLELVGADGEQYVIYYVKAASDSLTAIPVPKTEEGTTYEISGDNKEGFIVTVTITNN